MPAMWAWGPRCWIGHVIGSSVPVPGELPAILSIPNARTSEATSAIARITGFHARELGVIRTLIVAPFVPIGTPSPSVCIGRKVGGDKEKRIGEPPYVCSRL